MHTTNRHVKQRGEKACWVENRVFVISGVAHTNKISPLCYFGIHHANGYDATNHM